jgi:putative hydrolase of the HAD superfamily
MLVLFDVDDTLLDDAKATREAVDALREQMMLGVPELEFRARWFDSLRRNFERYVAGQIDFQEQRRARIRDVLSADLSDADSDEIFNVYLAAYEKAWSLFEDVLPCLEALGDHELGIVSNGNAQQQRRKLSRLSILDRFACVVVSEEFGWAKPDPCIFARACERGHATPHDVVHVGDRRDVDALGAARAGLRAVWLDRSGLDPSEQLSPGIARIATLAELAALID